MTRKMMFALAAPLALAIILCSLPRAEAQAAGRVGVVGIENATQVSIRLQHRWGEGQWDTDVISPGHRKWLWWKYSVSDHDKLHVRFESDLSHGVYKKYHLEEQFSDHDSNYVHKYVLKYNVNNQLIELSDER